jgi:hypothetical protein
MQTTSLALPTLLGLSLAASGCDLPGDRLDEVDDVEDRCPDDEVCAPETPYGLSFYINPGWVGASDPLMPMVAGGELVVYMRAPGSHEAFQLPWQASVTGPIEISEQGKSWVVLKGLAPGEGVLRIANLDDHFMDSATIEVVALHSIRLALGGQPTDDLPPRPVAVFASAGSFPTTVSLHSADGTELADDSSYFQLLSGGTSTGGWFDLIPRYRPDPSASLMRFEVKAGGVAHLVDFPVVSQLDHIEHSLSFRSLLDDHRNRPICFQAVAGGHRVAGVRWTLTSSPGITLLSSDGACTILHATPGASGDAWVTAQAGDLTHTINLRIDIEQ